MDDSVVCRKMSPTAKERAYRAVIKVLVSREGEANIPLIREIENAYTDGFRTALAMLAEPSEGLVEAMAAARYQVPVEWSYDQRTTNYWSGASETVRQNERYGMRDALRAAVTHLGEDKEP